MQAGFSTADGKSRIKGRIKGQGAIRQGSARELVKNDVSRRSELAVLTHRGPDALKTATALWAASGDISAAPTLQPDAAFLAHVAAADPDTEMRVVTVSRGGRVRALWPFAVVKTGPLRRAVRIGRALQCYDCMRLREEADAVDAPQAAWTEVSSWRDVDVASFPHLRPDSPLLRIDAVAAAARLTDRAPAVDLTRFETPEAFRPSLSKNRRGSLKRREKKLSARGALTFETLRDPRARVEAVEIGMAFKRAWLAEHCIVSAAYGSDYFDRAFLSAAADPACVETLVIHALKLDGEIIAVEIGLSAGSVYKSHIGAFAPERAGDGAGAILTVKAVEWCIAQGYDVYDLLPPETAFKRDWTTGSTPLHEATLGLSPLGRLSVPLVRDGKRIAKAILGALPMPVRSLMQGVVCRLSRDR